MIVLEKGTVRGYKQGRQNDQICFVGIHIGKGRVNDHPGYWASLTSKEAAASIPAWLERSSSEGEKRHT